jgi:hypothetical protein
VKIGNNAIAVITFLRIFFIIKTYRFASIVRIATFLAAIGLPKA